MNATWKVVLLVLAVGLAGAAWNGSSAMAATGRCFAGNGSKDLAPFRVRRPSTLRWQAKGGYFFLSNHRLTPMLNVVSSGTRGTTYVRPGVYAIAVGAVDAWRFCIVSR